MSCIPAGAESEDEDDFYAYDDYGNESMSPEKNQSPTGSPSKAATSEVNGISKPKRNSIIGTNESSEPVLLGDIKMAITNGNLAQLKDLIERQMNNLFFVDTILMADWTGLMFAANIGNEEIVHYLLERNADPNYHADSTTDMTPLMAVGASKSTDEQELISCARYLLDFGANINAVDSCGYSALIFAAKTGKSGLVEELLNHKADVNHVTEQGWSALHWAVNGGYGDVIVNLLNSGADVTAKTYRDKSASDIALSKGYQKIKDILDNYTQRVIDLSNGPSIEDNVDIEKRRLSEQEMTELSKFVRPSTVIECREKSKSVKEYKPLVPNIEELEEFLLQTNYHHLLPEFERHNLGYQDLVVDCEGALTKIGVQDAATLRKLSAHIILMHKQNWKKESLKEMNLDTCLTCPEVLAIMSNIANHLTRIDQTIAFLKRRITKAPEILSYNSDVVPKEKIFNETLQSLINTRLLYAELQSLRTAIAAIEDIGEPQRPDVMSIPFCLEDQLNAANDINRHNKSSKYSKTMILSVLSVSALTVLAVKYGNVNRDNLFSFAIQLIPRPKIPKFTNILLTL